MRALLIGATLLAAALAGHPAAAQPPPGMGGQTGLPPGFGGFGPPGGPDAGAGQRPMLPAGKAAMFSLSRGDTSLTIKCADEEPTKACVDAAAGLLDRFVATPR